MNKISFELKDPKAEYSAIILRLSCSDGRLKYYTGESIASSKWYPDAQTTDDRGIKAKLERIRKAIEALNQDLKIRGHLLTRDAVREALDKQIKHRRQSGLFEKMQSIVDQMREGKILTPQKKKYAKLSLKTLDFTIALLQRFRPDMEIVTMQTYYDFIRYCHDRDYSTNYIGGQIKNWKTLGYMATGNPIYTDKEFKKITEDTFDVYLDELELKKMFSLKLDSREGLVRDWFILDCYTGLRISDLKLLSGKNLSGGFITIANEKTDEKVVIPVHPYVKAIIQRYKGFPRVVTDVEINRTIKKVAEKAGIDQDVLFTITKGGVRVDTYLKKYQMISNHTARRSFITNLRKNGVADTIVMKLTGIKSFSTLRRYDKLSADEAAKIAAGLKFFN